MIETKLLTFQEVLAAAENNPAWTVITRGDSYFTVENHEGYRAYVQVECYGYHYDNPNYYRCFWASTTHKPNKKTGSGWQVGSVPPNVTLMQVIRLINNALEKSKMKVESGAEQKDTRKPSENGKYLV